MGIFQRCWEGVKSAATSVSTLAYLARGAVFTAGMITIAIRELGWDKIFAYEAACDIATLACEDYCEPSQTVQALLPPLVYSIQAVSVSLMVAAYSRGFWRSTNLSTLRTHFLPTDQLNADDPKMTTGMKVCFGILIGGATINYSANMFRNYIGGLEELQQEFLIEPQVAECLAISMTILWSMVSVAIKMPDFIAHAHTNCKHPVLPKSYCRVTTLGLLGSAMSISTVDYLSRFLESKQQNIDDYIPALVTTGVFAFIFAIFTSGASLDDISQLRAKVAKGGAVPITIASLLALDGLIWWVFNTNQLSGRVEQWVAPSNTNSVANSTQFKDFCWAQFENRATDVKQDIAITLACAVATLPLTVCMTLYLASLLLLDRRKHPSYSMVRSGDQEMGFLEEEPPANRVCCRF